MRAAVAQPESGIGMRHHLVDIVQAPAMIVHQREIHQRVAALFQHPVEQHLARLLALAGRHRRGAVFGRRFVIGRIAQPEHLVIIRAQHGHDFADRIFRRFGEQLPAELVIVQRLHLFVQRRAPDLAEGLVHDEGVERRGEPQQHAGRPRRHLAAHGHAVGIGLGDQFQHAGPAMRPAVVLLDGERQRTAGHFRHAADHREFLVHILEIGDELQHAFARRADGARNAVQLVLFGFQRRRVRAVAVLVLHRARGGKAERARLDGLGGKLRHRLYVVRHGGFELRRPLAHHIGAQRRMRHLQSDIERQRRGFHGIHIVGKAFPVPLDAFDKRRTRNIFHALHQADQPVMPLRLAGRKAHAAIAENGGGHAVKGRGLEIGVPGDLAVIVGVDIHETRRDDLAARVDLLAPAIAHRADFGNDAIVDGDVALERRAAQPVIDGAILDHEIMHGFFLPKEMFLLGGSVAETDPKEKRRGKTQLVCCFPRS